MSGSLSVLIVTNLFPSQQRPGFAPFNRQQFGALSKLADVEVFALVPRSPIARSSGLPRKEVFDGIEVRRPRFVTVPGAIALNATSIAASVTAHIAARRVRGKRFDVVLGAYAYPDACGAILAAEAHRLPVVVKCHGSDLNRVPEHTSARIQIERLLPRAANVVCVSRDLAETAQVLGVPRERVTVVYNGIDRDRFRIRDRAEAKKSIGLGDLDEVVLFVGHLADHKGAKDLLDAADRLAERRPQATIVFVGDGPMLETLQGSGKSNVRAVGRVPHEAVATYMGACDVLTLPSWDEGMPNVVREAHASGRPVVATNVGGIPEAVHAPELGRLVPPSNAAVLADALADELEKPRVDPRRIAAMAEVPTWSESAAQLFDVLRAAAR